MPRTEDELIGGPPQVGPPDADEDRGHLRPKMGRRARDRLALGLPGVARLVLRGHGRRAAVRSEVRALPAGPGHRRNARRVTIQAHVHRLHRGGAKGASEHLAYIERPGAGKDDSPAVLYGPDGLVPRKRFEQPRLDEQHQFRFMASPENGHELDLDDYVRRLMRRVERDLGRSLEWAAANHYDTDHPHAHVVVRGVDLEGRRVLLSRQYISHGMRGTAQELATELLGPRLESEIQRTREQEVTRERLTSLDRELQRCATDHRVDVASVRRQSRDGQEAQHLLDRLEHLERIGVAARISPTTWALMEGWQQHLRELGERGDIMKQIHRAMRGGDPAHYYPVRPGQGLPDGRGGIEERPLVGRVVSKGLEDETRGVWYAVLETPTGAAYHVRLSTRQVETTRTGDLVTFATSGDAAVRPVDRHIADVTARRGGVYSLAGDGGQAPAGRAAIARLRELERLGMVTARARGEWNVPADLLAQLEKRQREQAARYRLTMQPARLSLDAQVTHKGPVWLDTLDRASLARQGFGAEVLAAVERRHRMLRELGIDPGDPQRAAKLRDVEYRAIGRELERRTGQTFLELIPSCFQGRLQPTPEGSRYLAVSDGQRFVLVPATSEARSWAGRSVDVSRDASSRVLVVPDNPARDAARQELTRRAAGERLALETRQTFLPAVPDGFRGRVQRSPPGAPHMVVSDGARFVLVPSTSEASAFAMRGETVQVARDVDGRCLGLRPERGLERGR